MFGAGHADATALLLAHGANSNRQDRKGRSPAHCGCAKGQFETIKLIGNYPVNFSFNIIKFLLLCLLPTLAAHGANLWLRNARGDLPLHDAAASGRRDLVIWLLQLRPSQVNARNNDGRCPLHMAALNDNVDMCKVGINLLINKWYLSPVNNASILICLYDYAALKIDPYLELWFVYLFFPLRSLSLSLSLNKLVLCVLIR